jgi:malate dehydrogenase (oxaloacetate-decarboxylating)(NADP+)
MIPSLPHLLARLRLPALPRGLELLHHSALNKGTAFTEAERDALGLRGLLPPKVSTIEEQCARVLENFRRKTSPLEKYIHLIALQDRNETLFYRVILDHLEETMPVVYTPTVGLACQQYGHIYRRARGLFVATRDRGRVEEVLRHWPCPDVRVVVVTDGERILGLGDLGANGMGIPVGKLTLYTACAGIDPRQGLPVTLDVGTDNTELLRDPLYLGEPHPRLRGEAYEDLVDEFVQAVQRVFPRALIQFEDFATRNAFRWVRHYRDRICTFNDDIQGTGAVTLAGLYAATRVTGTRLADQRLLMVGAGEAAIGIADLVTAALVDEGLPPDEARRRCWLFDSHGLVVAARTDLAPHKQPYAHGHPGIRGLEEAVAELKPTALVGVAAQPGLFSRTILERMAALHERPLVFALSNPTAKAECTAEEAYTWTRGQAVFASGSPFAPVEYGGRTFRPGQANNAYIFPGVGLGVVASGARRVTEEMFLAAARTLASEIQPADLAAGALFPPWSRIREVSARIATAVAETAFRRDLATRSPVADPATLVRAEMFDPVYPAYV